MSALITVASREFVERRLLLVAALVLGLLPLVLPPFFPSYPPAEVRGATVLIAAFALLPAFALLLGGSIVARDLLERRLGFYFARPISALAIIGGKFGGAVALLVVAVLLLMVPALMIGTELDGAPAAPSMLALALAGVVLFLLAVGHAGVIVMRSGSLWIVFDVLAAAFAGFGMFSTWRRLADVPNDFMRPGMAVVGVVAFIALVAGITLSFVRGRTDLVCTHRILSLCTWVPTLSSVAAVAVLGGWALRATPGDLHGTSRVITAPSGGWSLVAGPARHTLAHFLLEPETGRFRRINSVTYLAFSGDGRTAAWGERSVRRNVVTTDLRTLRLDDPSAKVGSPMVPLPQGCRLTLSDDGRLLATVAHDSVSVLEVSSGRTLTAVTLPPYQGTVGLLRAQFLPSGHLRLWGHGEIRNIDPIAGRSEVVGQIADNLRVVRIDRDGSRILANSVSGGHPSLLLLDGETGALTATLVDSTAASGGLSNCDFLADRRIVALLGGSIHLFGPTGVAERTITLTGSDVFLRLGDQSVPGKLTVGLVSRVDSVPDLLVVVDLADGRVDRQEPGLLPTQGMWARSSSGNAGTGGLQARLFIGPQCSLILLDPASGTRREIVRGGDQD